MSKTTHATHAKHNDNTQCLTIRMHSGLSGDMFLAGLLALSPQPEDVLDAFLAGLLPQLKGSVRLVPRHIQHIAGWRAQVSLPHEHCHRSLADILTIIRGSTMHKDARHYAENAFTRIATAEGAVHNIDPQHVHFHEVGALDSIVDICLTCELFARLQPACFVASPIPIADGSVHCAHGVLPVPAPAVLRMLEGVPVCAFAGRGETITPTAIALLHALGAHFGPWPSICVTKCVIAYGTREFTNAPNGATFALGTMFDAQAAEMYTGAGCANPHCHHAHHRD